MVRYFLHLTDGHDEILDPEGEQHASIETLRLSMIRAARDIVSHAVKRNGDVDFTYRIEAHDEAGNIALVVPFSEAIRIIPG